MSFPDFLAPPPTGRAARLSPGAAAFRALPATFILVTLDLATDAETWREADVGTDAAGLAAALARGEHCTGGTVLRHVVRLDPATGALRDVTAEVLRDVAPLCAAQAWTPPRLRPAFAAYGIPAPAGNKLLREVA